ncbi:MAG: hypothetical protein U0641_10790 [Anaerolineae bacterium]
MYAHIRLWAVDTAGRDIYYSWVEGSRILQGADPYARILAGDMLENDKYATYFPLFYLLSAGSQALGWRDYDSWLAAWRVIFLVCQVGIGLLIWIIYAQYRQWLAGLLAAMLWWLNSWSLIVTYIAHLDTIPILFLVMSLYWLDKRPKTALLLLSLSLALKQIAIFVAPLYLIWIWRASRQRRDIAAAILILVSVPLVTSLPFLAWSAEGYIKSISFSMTRFAYVEQSIGVILFGSGGLLSRLPMLVGCGFVYLLAWRGVLGRYTSSMLSMLAFGLLTPVFFVQYMIWIIALILLTPCDMFMRQPTLQADV